MLHPDFQLILENDKNILMYISLYQLDELMEKLKLLNYERTLLKEMKMKPLHRNYFIKSFNPGEQFFMFTSICAWLIRKTGRDFEQPQEFHDPTTTIANIVKVLQEMDISTDFPTNKLMQGAGFVCCYVLDCLVTNAIKINKIQFKMPEVNVDDDEIPPELLDNDNEIILEKFEEEQNAVFSDDSADENYTPHNNNNNAMMDFKHSNLSNGNNIEAVTTTNNYANEYKVDSLIDSENWRLEFEKALPQLKVVVKTDPRNWRAHWEQMRIYRENIKIAAEDTQNQLSKLQNDIIFTMDKIDSREKHLNNDLKNLIQQYKTISLEYAQIRNGIKENDLEKLSIEQDLVKITRDHDNVKLQMEQRGNLMSDGSSLLNIKKAIAKVKEEIVQMELEIGVMKHTIDQDILKQNILFADMDPLMGGNF